MLQFCVYHPGVGDQPGFCFTCVLGNIQLIHQSNQMTDMVSKQNFFQLHPNPFSRYPSQAFGILLNRLQRAGFMIARIFRNSSVKPAQIKTLSVRAENNESTFCCYSETRCHDRGNKTLEETTT